MIIEITKISVHKLQHPQLFTVVLSAGLPSNTPGVAGERLRNFPFSDFLLIEERPPTNRFIWNACKSNFSVAVACLCMRIFFCFSTTKLILKFPMRVWKHVIGDVTFLWHEPRKEDDSWVLDYILTTKFYSDLSSPISSCGQPKMLLMSPRTSLACFLSVLVAFCSGLEFEERGKLEIRL